MFLLIAPRHLFHKKFLSFWYFLGFLFGFPFVVKFTQSFYKESSLMFIWEASDDLQWCRKIVCEVLASPCICCYFVILWFSPINIKQNWLLWLFQVNPSLLVEFLCLRWRLKIFFEAFLWILSFAIYLSFLVNLKLSQCNDRPYPVSCEL